MAYKLDPHGVLILGEALFFNWVRPLGVYFFLGGGNIGWKGHNSGNTVAQLAHPPEACELRLGWFRCSSLGLHIPRVPEYTKKSVP